MIETSNNIIFWVGYAVSFSFLLGVFVFSWYIIIKGVLGVPYFFSQIFNKMLDRSFKNSSPEAFSEWQERMIKRYKDLQSNISPEQRAYIDEKHKNNILSKKNDPHTL